MSVSKCSPDRNSEVVPLVADAGPNNLSFAELLALEPYYFSLHPWLSAEYDSVIFHPDSLSL